MRKSKSETAQTRQRIVRAAALAFRSNGIHATGVAEIMSAAGLTPGGFYRHFASKEHLIAEACAAGIESTIDAIDASAQAGEQAFIDHFEAYLWDKNRRNTLIECPLIAMGSELVRADIETRRAATRGYCELIGVMASVGESDEGSAMFAFSAMLGALTISRIVDDPELAGRILDETKRRVVGLWPIAPDGQACTDSKDGDAEKTALIGDISTPM
ncbi:TetR/AcrR family transcriptional regulator [Caballeronia insecticola]|uniref:Transcriptional regulator TetR family n=1 Tax=Caballeronia insecticola TaxID=758793 RepID=R4WUG2_9BURK|nr:TetR/AcrR family transcriptional regulator [Caballeronia insecticola]BAN28223.1 transcriptional regulator TetR family [Caballeronia insecticola]